MRTEREQYIGGNIDRNGGTLKSPYIEERINTAKGGRRELWCYAPCGGDQWMLWKAQPATRWKDRFMSQAVFVGVGANVAISFLNSEMPWVVNGRRNGANDPNSTSFVPANEPGGGIDIIVPAGGQVGDYIAMHFGGDYSVLTSLSPHWHMDVKLLNDTDVGYLIGLVGATNKPVENDVWAIPDDGYWFRLDTDAVDGYGDNSLRAVVRSNGVDRLVTNLGTPSFVDKTHLSIVVNDAGDEVSFLKDGFVVATHDADLPTAQLQPYQAVVGRAVGIKEMKIFHFRHIQDLA